MDQFLNSQLSEVINKVVTDYTNVICDKFSLKFEDVYVLWSNSHVQTGSTKTKAKKKNEEKEDKTVNKIMKQQTKIGEILEHFSKDLKPNSIDLETVQSEDKKESNLETSSSSGVSLEKMTRTELVGLCRKHGQKVGGTKEELISRLKAFMKKETPKKSATKENILKKITQNIPVIEIKRNKFGNYEHTDTGIVFDKEDKIAFGVQRPDGNIEELTDETIELCKKYKFMYKVPENLDKNKSSLKDIKIENETLNEEDFYEPPDDKKEDDEEEEEDILYDE